MLAFPILLAACDSWQFLKMTGVGVLLIETSSGLIYTTSLLLAGSALPALVLAGFIMKPFNVVLGAIRVVALGRELRGSIAAW